MDMDNPYFYVFQNISNGISSMSYDFVEVAPDASEGIDWTGFLSNFLGEFIKISYHF